MTHRSIPLRVDWLLCGTVPFMNVSGPWPGRLGLSWCPGRPDSAVQLAVDVWRMRELRIRSVLSLVDPAEMRMYGVTGLAEALAEAGIRHLSFPMPDGCPPDDPPQARALCRRVLGWLGEGDNVLVHCIGGWGRSGTIAAALLIHEGHDAESAIARVRQARSPMCVESAAQEAFLHRYAEDQRRMERRYLVLPRQQAKIGLAGGPGERRWLGAGSGPPVPGGQLALALDALRRRESDAAVAVLSGEVAVSEAAPDVFPVDRAHLLVDGVLISVAFGEV